MKRNSPTYPTFAMCLVGAASTVASFHAGAFQLGQIQSTSRLGEPLAAHINLMMSPRESLLETTLSVLPAFDYRNDPTMRAALNTISAKIVRSEYGHHYIALSSSQELNLPLISFRLKAANGQNILIQSYSLSPNPPLRANPRDVAQATTGRRRAPVAQPPARSTTQSAPLIAGNEYGPVKAGDTLWRIAARVAGREKAGEILNQLFELNPHAFINGDINKLKQGVNLTLPAVNNSQQIDLEEPISSTQVSDIPSELPGDLQEDLLGTPEEEFEVADLEATVTDSLRSTNGANLIEGNVFDDGMAVVDPLPESSGTEITDADVLASTSTNAAPLDWRAENPELSEKLSQLGSKYAALRARYATQSNVTAEQEPPFTKSALAVAVTDSLAPQAEPITANETANQELTPTPLVAPSVENSRFALPPWLLLMLGISLGVSALGFLFYRSRVASKRAAERLLRKEKDSSLKQELAKKAQHRILMEDEVERMLHEQIEDDGDEIEKTMQLHVDELIPEAAAEITMSAEDSATSKIDSSISHGRYAEAEELLREVIVDSPRNFTAKLRLAEVYYITEKISDFVNISQDIHAHHRPDISDEDWRRVMRMGKMIAPEQAPFSGPQSIMDDASAG